MSILDNTPLDLDQYTGGKLFKGTPIEGIGDNGAGDKARMEEQVGNAQRAYSGLETPTVGTVNYANPNAVADVGAERAIAEGQGASEYNKINVDPAYKQAQADQMAALSSLAKSGGANATSRANLAQIQQGQNANANAQRGAILQNAQMRGQGGSGSSLLAQLNATQSQQNQANDQGLKVAAMQQQTGLQAGQGAANIGAGLQNQEWGEKSEAAKAQNEINRFNAASNTQNSQFNAGQENTIAQTNAARQQQVENARVAALNESIKQNQILTPQQQYTNQLARAQGVANTNISGAKMSQEDRAAALKNQQNIWNSAIGLGGQAWSYLGGASGIGGMLGMGGAEGGAAWAGGDMAGAGIAGGGGAMSGGAAAGEGATAAEIAAASASASTTASTGGVIPGKPVVAGDSVKNDIVQVNASPGEVIVPRTLAKRGSPEEIAQFVMRPPQVAPAAPVAAPVDRTEDLRALHALANKGR